MAKVIALCGKICSGKSFYARQLRDSLPAVILSCDEVMLGLFGPDLGELHDAVSRNVRTFLMDKAVEVVRAGANVVLDFGFWLRSDREQAAAFFAGQGVPMEWRWLNVDDVTWRRNIAARNEAVRRGADSAYYVDEGLMEKCLRLFEPPTEEEMDFILSPQRD